MGVLFQVFIAEVATFVCVSDIPNLDFDLAGFFHNYMHNFSNNFLYNFLHNFLHNKC